MRHEKWSTRKDINKYIFKKSPDKGFLCSGIGHLKADKGVSIRTRRSELEFGRFILFYFIFLYFFEEREARDTHPVLSHPIPSSPVRYGLNSVPAENLACQSVLET